MNFARGKIATLCAEFRWVLNLDRPYNSLSYPSACRHIICYIMYCKKRKDLLTQSQYCTQLANTHNVVTSYTFAFTCRMPCCSLTWKRLNKRFNVPCNSLCNLRIIEKDMNSIEITYSYDTSGRKNALNQIYYKNNNTKKTK